MIKQPRPIRSYVRREGRMTPSQKSGLDALWGKYGLETTNPFPFNEVDQPLILEIGFGMGESLIKHAQAQPETQFIGIEVHRPGVGRLLNEVDQLEMRNLHVYCEDAKEVLAKIDDGKLSKVQIFFPDPWPKKKHHKRRLVQPEFMAQVATKLKKGGIVHLATDWQDYHEHMLEVFEKTSFELADESVVKALAEARPASRFEQRGIRLGHAIHDHAWVKP